MKKLKKRDEVKYCEKCGKKMSITARDSHLGINSMMGYINFNRNLYYCRRCEEGFAPFDKELDVNDEHRITKNLIETICDLAQRMSSFGEAEEILL